MKTIFAWIGKADLNENSEGPIEHALKNSQFDEAILITNSKVNTQYENKISQLLGKLELKSVNLNSPTNHEEIYNLVSPIVENYLKANQNSNIFFHLSPGTPAMATVWVILAKTKFQATLIETSKEKGLQEVHIPFDMSAEYIPKTDYKKFQKNLLSSTPLSPSFSSIIYKSSEMQKVVTKAHVVSMHNVPVLLEGESGTGKELLAKSIHYSSERKNKAFIAVNCGAISENLIEAELFGSIKGSYTGSNSDRPGFFQAANSGTLFLDEIGELPLNVQVKLLRVLQEGEVTPVGSTKPIKVDVRIISATHRNLIESVSSGKFREDLFYRVAVAVLHLPPLRERKGDINLLVDNLMNQYKHKKISAGARKIILSHNWPGNIRELNNTLMRAIIWSENESITEDEMKDSILFIDRKSDETTLLPHFNEKINLPDLLAKIAKLYIRKALLNANNNKTLAAKNLGLPNYQTLSNWMEKYDVK